MLGPDHRPMMAHEAKSEWIRSFDVRNVKCLVVCRGPVRKEAFEVFDEIGIREYGMLLSEKDSIVYPRCLAPELRDFRFPGNIHRVADYMGAGQEEKLQRIREIIQIARGHGYTHVFAGYGFMAEDADFIAAIEAADLCFVGPSSAVIRKAGAKDEAKKLARSLGNAVVPGVDDVSSRALLAAHPDRKALEKLAKAKGLDFTFDESVELGDNAEALLQLGYAKSIELVTIDELQREAEKISKEIWADYPGKRIRYKCIGGGGGKGQRVVSEISETANAVFEILAEQKVVEPGSNRNFLVELNLETTRHNEIQVVGNGHWSISLGGRDCSIQMREQKQLEFSLTDELLAEAAASREGAVKANLERDRETLAAMERDAERFGEGVELNNVSTFECIVEGFDHFFMEMNTRIQVEHGVTELAYRMKFTNPDDPTEFFYVERLIEAMVLLACHGERLPRPERELRHVSGAEIRVNATNAALNPHAGGVIRGWSAPLPFEIRDDQGIGTRNPDTGAFPYYNLAGAYDSNIALILTDGTSRRHNLERLSEILRRMELRGENLETSIPVQYGLINWTLGVEPMMKPNTRFLVSYLAAVGSLQEIARDVDLEMAAAALVSRQPTSEAKQCLQAKETLLMRPLERVLADPHALAGFIGLYAGRAWREHDGKVEFLKNPVHLLRELYHYLDMEHSSEKPPSEMIWDHDDEVLTEAIDFYGRIAQLTGVDDWAETRALLEGGIHESVAGDDEDLWAACQAAHRGFQCGLDLLLVLPRIALQSGFSEIGVNDALEPVLPEQYTDPKRMPELVKCLAPPPLASSNEIITPMGGTFYSREAPGLPELIQEGDHFEAGQPLFIIEVMKMFNKIPAPFAGTVKRCAMKDADGHVVKAGQLIFEIEPDDVIVVESDEEKQARRKSVTLGLLAD